MKNRPMIVGVIASPADLKFALAIREPPDLFELRLDYLCAMLDELERKIPKLVRPIIITARDPREGGLGNLSPETRRALLRRFLAHARFIDVELCSARQFKSLLEDAKKRKVGRILSYHNFNSTPSARSLCTKAKQAKALGADIFKAATRTDSPAALSRLVDFITNKDLNFPISAMGMGELGGISRLLLARCGSVLSYASLERPNLKGQLSIAVLRSAICASPK